MRQRASPCVCQEASKRPASRIQPLAPRLKTPNPMIETLLLPLKTRFHTGRKGIPNSAMECHRKQMSATSSIVAVKLKSLGHPSNGHRKCATWVASSLYHAAPWAELILTFYRQRRHFHVSGYPRYRSTKGSARNPKLTCRANALKAERLTAIRKLGFTCSVHDAWHWSGPLLIQHRTVCSALVLSAPGG